MVQLLWRRATDGKVFDSPERRAALDKDLRGTISAIRDASIKRHYGAEIKRLRDDLFGYGAEAMPGAPPRFTSTRAGASRRGVALPTPSARGSELATAEGSQDWLREALVLATLARNPWFIPDFDESLLEHAFTDQDLARLAGALLSAPDEVANMPAHLESKGCAGTLESLLSRAHLRIAPALREGASEDTVRQTLKEEFAKLAARRGCDREVSEALSEIDTREDEGITWRLGQAAEARNQAERSAQEDKTQYDLAENGARLDREERAALDRMLERITFAKGESRGG
jgi:DNA primase